MAVLEVVPGRETAYDAVPADIAAQARVELKALDWRATRARRSDVQRARHLAIHGKLIEQLQVCLGDLDTVRPDSMVECLVAWDARLALDADEDPEMAVKVHAHTLKDEACHEV
jgi:hypothetical protein